MYVKDGKWFGNPASAVVGGQAAMTTTAMVMTKGPIVSSGWPFPEKNGYGGTNAPEPRILTTVRLRELAIRAGMDGSGVAFNQRVGLAFQKAMTTSIRLIGMPWWPNQNTTPHVSPARAFRTGGLVSTVVPDVVADHFEVTDNLPRYFRSSTLIEVKAVKGRITMGHSNHQTLGLIDATKRSPMGQFVNRMPWSANPALVFVTTGDTVISPRILSCGFDGGVDIQRSYAYETYEDHIRASWAESLTWDMEFRANLFKFPTEVFATHGRSVTLSGQLLLPMFDDPDPAELWPNVVDDDPPYSPVLPACNVDWR
jgi:hypothetical protein